MQTELGASLRLWKSAYELGSFKEERLKAEAMMASAEKAYLAVLANEKPLGELEMATRQHVILLISCIFHWFQRDQFAYELLLTSTILDSRLFAISILSSHGAIEQAENLLKTTNLIFGDSLAIDLVRAELLAKTVTILANFERGWIHPSNKPSMFCKSFVTHIHSYPSCFSDKQAVYVDWVNTKKPASCYFPLIR